MNSLPRGPFRPIFSASIPAGTVPVRIPVRGMGGWISATNASTATASVGFDDDRLPVPESRDVVIPPGRSVLIRVPEAATHLRAVLNFGAGGIFFTNRKRDVFRCL